MIYIKPYHHKDRLATLTPEPLSPDFLWGDREHLFFATGKKAIHFLINKLQLTREDEVCILTSTDSNYVSTCVSATFFNYCKVSRVPTEKTKLIYIIHEFGLPYRRVESVVKQAKEQDIPVVEDCAHALDSTLNGKQIGSFGDYAIYSLSKHLPMENAGLLVGSDLNASENGYYDEAAARETEAEFMAFKDYLLPLSARKKANYQKIASAVNLKTVLPFEDTWTPHLIVFETEYADALYAATSSLMEPHPLHVKNWFAIGLQPLMTEIELEGIIERINTVVNR